MQPFPGGIIPANRITPTCKSCSRLSVAECSDIINGGALNPMAPGTTTRCRIPRPAGRQNSLRVDYNITDKWRAFLPRTNESTSNKGANSTSTLCLDAPMRRQLQTDGAEPRKGTVTWIASPTLVNEVVFGYGLWTEKPGLSRCLAREVQRDKLGTTSRRSIRPESAQT